MSAATAVSTDAPDASKSASASDTAAPKGQGTARSWRSELWPLAPWMVDTITLWAFGLAAYLLTRRLWADPTHTVLAYGSDQPGFEWIIRYAAFAIGDGHNPLFTELQNAPLGINVMAQTSILGLSLPLAPITWLFGPDITFLLILSGSLAGTAAAWYFFLSRIVTTSRYAAIAGSALIGFGPPMISHAYGGHLNYIALFLIPILLWRLIALVNSGRWLRDGALVGLVVTYQIFIGEEPLLVAALGITIFAIVYAAFRPVWAWSRLPKTAAGLGIAGAVVLLLAGYPLWWQFFGTQSYTGIPHASAWGNNLYAITGFSSQSLGGGHPVGTLAMNAFEENGFLGWPLLAFAVVISAWLWRTSLLVRVTAITTLVFTLLSFGEEINIGDYKAPIPGPWQLLSGVPLVEGILPGRLMFISMTGIGILLALAGARLLEVARENLPTANTLRVLFFGAVIAVLLPIAPTGAEVAFRADAPALFRSDAWRDVIKPNSTVVAVPPADGTHLAPLRWQVEAEMGFRQIEGYFIGPHGEDDHGFYGAVRRPTASLLWTVGQTGVVPPITQYEQETARDDIRFWNADYFVLDVTHPNAAALISLVSQLLGDEGKETGGVRIWDVRTPAN